MIWHLATHPDHQRQGIASALLAEAETRTRERGIVRLEAWTDRREEIRARYARVHDDVLYEKRLIAD